MSDPKWISFTERDRSPSGKTRVWTVDSTINNVILGEIKWSGPWRKYVFWPLGDTFYEEDCLRSISEFIERQTMEHRAKALSTFSNP